MRTENPVQSPSAEIANHKQVESRVAVDELEQKFRRIVDLNFEVHYRRRPWTSSYPSQIRFTVCCITSSPVISCVMYKWIETPTIP